MKILVTGANGHIGVALIRRIHEVQPNNEVVAIVRSEEAALSLRKKVANVDARVVSYTDAKAIYREGQGAEVVYHLVGIIKESSTNTYEIAHKKTSKALVEAGIDATHIVALGILGSKDDSTNSCFKSRAVSDAVLLSGPIPATIVRVPMVLGPGDYASRALANNAASSFAFCFRSSSLEQPIYSVDVVDAIISAASLAPKNRVMELAGPESLTRKKLIQRAGVIIDNEPRVLSFPIAFGLFLAWVLERTSSNPPVTRAMLGVLDHDDNIDTREAADTLGLVLTPLDEMLENVLAI